MKRALIVASGLRGIIGHNFFYTQTVQRELEKRGFEVTVLVNKHAPADLIKETNYQPVFSIGTYDFIPLNSPVQDLKYLYLQSGIYSFELQASLKDKDFDLTFCHTVADFELIAWNRFLKKQKFKGHLFVMQRNTPQFANLPKWKKVIHPFFRLRPYYLNALDRRMKRRFTLLTDSELLTEDYAKICRRVVTAPIPLADSISQAEQGDNSTFPPCNLPKNDFIDFGYLGDSRDGKGFSMLPAMVEKVVSEKPKIRFLIQCPNSEYENAVMPDGLKELGKLAEKLKTNLILINERLSEKDYLRLFQFLDVIMIPYNSPMFIEGTSNIFTESAALGKPTVVSNNTWMSGELKKYGGGLEFEKGKVDDFAETVIKLTENYDEYAKKAADYSPVWKAKHNVKNLVDLLLREAKI
jgi:glycosyltransferase involved in cell wall biosynthesis